MTDTKSVTATATPAAKSPTAKPVPKTAQKSAVKPADKSTPELAEKPAQKQAKQAKKPKRQPAQKASSVPEALASSKPKAAKPSKGTAPAAKPAKARRATAITTADQAGTVAIEAKKKPKLVRDSFTMPRADFDLIDLLKERALGFKHPVKKSELLRAGLHALQALPDAKLKATLSGLTALKAGRPKKDI